MKKIINSILFLAIGTLAFAQGGDVFYSARMKKEMVPEVLIESIESDFPNEMDIEYYGIPVQMFEDVWYVEVDKPELLEEFDTYTVVVTSKGRKTYATYSKSGRLINQRTNMKDIPLPHIIQKAVNKHFPGWQTTGDKMSAVTYKDGRKEVKYKVSLAKGTAKFDAVFDGSGNLISGKTKHK